MNSDLESLQKLRALLERVQSNAARPPTSARAASSSNAAADALSNRGSARAAESGPSPGFHPRQPELDTSPELTAEAMATVPPSVPAAPASATREATFHAPDLDAREPSEAPPVSTPRSDPFSHAPSLEIESASRAPEEPSGAHDPADSSSDFDAVDQDADADFGHGAVFDSAPLDDMDVPPISTEQEREDDELGSGLGFTRGDVDESDDDETSVPRTPPPESGPQVSIPPKDADLGSLGGSTGGTVHSSGPTMEQLGSTIDFDGDDLPPADLELAERAPSSAAPAPADEADEYEAELPQNQFSGAYDTSLTPPATAKADLEQHDKQASEREARISRPPAIPPARTSRPSVTGIELGDAEVIGRPQAGSGSPAVYERRQVTGTLATFLSRLDASLALKL